MMGEWKSRDWAWWVATVGGLGTVPVAPGTVGSVAGLFLAWLMNRILPSLGAVAGSAVTIVVLVGVTIVGVVAASAVAAGGGERDPSMIVIDEVCGMLVTVTALPFTALTVGSGFLFFRLFDIMKPFPISWIERRWPGGWGIMGDDLAAGVAANLSVRLLLVLLP
jgi:phosphatidylglycerophosphatase A